MYFKIPMAFVLGIALTAPNASAAGAAPTPAPATSVPTPPPEIYHVISRPLCTALRKRIGPAVGMILQNDQTIKKGPPLFGDYNWAEGYGTDASRNLTLMRMSNLVGPLANNIIAIKNQLSDPELFPTHPQTADQQAAVDLKNKLLNALGPQETSLDIINGFVETQNLADLQHRDEGLIKSMSQPDVNTIQGTATPGPFQNKDQAGINGAEPDPYFIDPAQVPGLTLGYNTTTRLRDALQWTEKETATRETTAAQAMTTAIRSCGGQVPGSEPAATPTPPTP